MHRDSLYFPNLNGLRFVAAFLVLIHHIEQNKSIAKIPNYWGYPVIELIGKLGVVLFFVLSGFLITYLLLKEKEETNTISIKNFYTRRILRIWPLYYLIVILSFFILPHIHFLDMGNWSAELFHHYYVKILLFVFMLPNLALAFLPRIPYAAQEWSIGVEEQFYFIWPFLVKHSKKLHKTIAYIIVLYIALKFLFIYLHQIYPGNSWITKVNVFWYYLFIIDAMAFGGLAAYILFNKKEQLLKFVYHKAMQAGIYIITISLILFGKTFSSMTYEVYSILFAFIIINLADNKQSLVNLEKNWINYLGKISYGIYMFHILTTTIVIKLLIFTGIYNDFLAYIFSFALTIAVSVLSYEFFEKKFIKQKVRFSTVVSGDNAKDLKEQTSTKIIPMKEKVLEIEKEVLVSK